MSTEVELFEFQDVPGRPSIRGYIDSTGLAQVSTNGVALPRTLALPSGVPYGFGIPGLGNVSIPLIVGMAGAQYVRTSDGTAGDASYADLATFNFSSAMGSVMGTRGFLDIESIWTRTGTTQDVNLNVMVGGSSIGTPTIASAGAILTAGLKLRLYAEGALNDQVALNSGTQPFVTSANALLERAIDFSADQSIQFQAKWAATPGAGATVRLLTYVVTVYPSPV